MELLKSKAAQKQRIDDAPNRDTLLRYFHEIDENMGAPDQTKAHGDFHGDFDTLLTLRDRVVRRLAMLELCDKAFQEARATDVDI